MSKVRPVTVPRPLPGPADAHANTDRLLWRDPPDDFYADSVSVTEGGGIAMQAGGTVVVLPVRRWVELAKMSSDADRLRTINAEAPRAMTAPDLAQLRDLAAKATPGPWRAMRDGNQMADGRLVGATRIDGLPRAFNKAAIRLEVLDRELATSRFTDEDADLIVAAVNALPGLIDRIDLMPGREAVAQWMIAHSYVTGHGDTIEDLLTELQIQVAERAVTSDFVEKTVRRFICVYCHRGRSTRAAIRRHVARCFHNPAARSCKTCNRHHPAQPFDFGTGDPGTLEACGAGIDLKDGMPVNCEKWEALP